MGRHKIFIREISNKLDYPRSYIGGMLNAIASDFTENNNTKNNNHY